VDATDAAGDAESGEGGKVRMLGADGGGAGGISWCDDSTTWGLRVVDSGGKRDSNVLGDVDCATSAGITTLLVARDVDTVVDTLERRAVCNAGNAASVNTYRGGGAGEVRLEV